MGFRVLDAGFGTRVKHWCLGLFVKYVFGLAAVMAGLGGVCSCARNGRSRREFRS